ncbi:kinesin-like protein KIF13A isoform X1 [Paramacrobiotus metropolitanus]|uniref:kinesin-like protein KIF13A isoform X1 n=1 Tax=Paramacrobiotus metropolitanus TaxID=2943436 RepID=UPI002445FE0E|nr:kinesin-like protein KIF13A isoform X1 [Paramacrobiotus metropolitanus]
MWHLVFAGRKVSRISLVDLAGSERASKTGAEGERLKEGSNINKSLSTLGLVISALADQSSNRGKNAFIPYRDSVLTWLLKDNLGGNSRTVMIATISAAADEYEETLSTLRYADRTKRIVNHAVINEDPNAKIIRELREEVEMLRKQLLLTKGKEIEERYAESKSILDNMNKPWEVKLKEAEQLHEDRKHALEQMGISVQSSGIKVEQGRYYLVNLNDDPSLNENLVYYLKDVNSVGRPEADEQPDIQLSGIGIRPNHAVLLIEAQELHVIPIDDAKTCVNGVEIACKTRLYNRDRLIFGNNHFFRVNCPKTENSGSTPEEPVNFESAREELFRNKMSDPATASLFHALESQYHEEKQRALLAQSQKYEKQLRQQEQYRSNLSMAGTPVSTPGVYGSSRDLLYRSSWNFAGATTPSYPGTPRYEVWNHEREEWFNKCLAQLKSEVIRANTFVQEARYLAKELGKETDYQVTLQIPVSNLTPNRKIYSSLSEAAIVVKRKHQPNQIWSVEKLQNKLIDMRELYNLWKGPEIPSVGYPDDQLLTAVDVDPFYEHEENHNLIGVANVFMTVLFHNVTLDCHVPIISQQGEIVGRLHVQISRVGGDLSMEDREGDAGEETDEDEEESENEDWDEDDESEAESDERRCYRRNEVVCRISIIEATGLPPTFANFVFCQYVFWGERDPVMVPTLSIRRQQTKAKEGARLLFNFTYDHTVSMNEDFLDFCQDGSLSIQVWGHKQSGNDSEWEVNKLDFKTKSIADHWSEVSRKLDMLVEIRELNDQGVYSPVDVDTGDSRKVLTGGVYQLRQGQQRHVHIKVTPALKGGFLPVDVFSIVSASIGNVEERDLRQQKGLDSYQEDDLRTLRSKWEVALQKRRQHLTEELEKLADKRAKSESDVEREKNLHDQFLTYTQELSSMHVPSPDSGIPGATAQGPGIEGMEMHFPVLYMDLHPDDVRAFAPLNDEFLVVGAFTKLPRENSDTMLEMHLVKGDSARAEATFSWDSSRHDSPALNCQTPPFNCIYLIVRAVLRLTHPAPLDLVLRKRICVRIVKKRTSVMWFAKSVLNAIASGGKMLTFTGVTYHIVSSLPKASEESENREQLALLAAAADPGSGTIEGESYIDLYLRNVLSVEMLLKRERDRQELKIKELLQRMGKPLRKTASVPTSIGGHFSRSHDVISSIRELRPSLDASISDITDGQSEVKERKTFRGRPTFLNIRPVVGSLSPTSPHEIYTPTPSKFASKMMPLVEEQQNEDIPERECLMSPIRTIPEKLFDSNHSLHSHTSLEIDGGNNSSHDSPLIKSTMQNSSSLSGISSGVGSQTNTQSSVSDDGSIRSSNVSPDIDSGYREPADTMVKSDFVEGKVEESEEIQGEKENGAPEESLEEAVKDDSVEQDDGERMDVEASLPHYTAEMETSKESLNEPSLISSDTDWIIVGKKVTLVRGNHLGVVRFIGPTSLGDGQWIGVALDGAHGKNDGSLEGKRYFTCSPKHGVFVRPAHIIPFHPKITTPSRSLPPSQPPSASNRKAPMKPVQNGTPKTPTSSKNPPASRTQKNQTSNSAKVPNGRRKNAAKE